MSVHHPSAAMSVQQPTGGSHTPVGTPGGHSPKYQPALTPQPGHPRSLRQPCATARTAEAQFRNNPASFVARGGSVNFPPGAALPAGVPPPPPGPAMQFASNMAQLTMPQASLGGKPEDGLPLRPPAPLGPQNGSRNSSKGITPGASPSATQPTSLHAFGNAPPAGGPPYPQPGVPSVSGPGSAGPTRPQSPIMSRRHSMAQPSQGAPDGGLQCRAGNASRRRSASPVNVNSALAQTLTRMPSLPPSEFDSQVASLVSVANASPESKQQLGAFLQAAASALIGNKSPPKDSAVPPSAQASDKDMAGLMQSMAHELESMQSRHASLMSSLTTQWESRFRDLEQRVMGRTMQLEQRVVQVESTVKNCLGMCTSTRSMMNDHITKVAKLGGLVEKTISAAELDKDALVWKKVERIEQDVDVLMQKLGLQVVQRPMIQEGVGKSEAPANTIQQTAILDKLSRTVDAPQPAPAAVPTKALGASTPTLSTREPAAGQNPQTPSFDKASFDDLLKRIRDLPYASTTPTSTTPTYSLVGSGQINPIPEEDDGEDKSPANNAVESVRAVLARLKDSNKEGPQPWQQGPGTSNDTAVRASEV